MSFYAIEVNGAVVGHISQSELQSIREKVLKDPTVWVGQAFSASSALFNMGKLGAKSTLWFGFCFALFTAYVDPQGLAALLSEMQSNPEILRQLVVVYLLASGVLAATSIAFVFATGVNFGLKDEFCGGIEKRLREKFRIDEYSRVNWYRTSSLVAEPLASGSVITKTSESKE
jgi:hypothetical protein